MPLAHLGLFCFRKIGAARVELAQPKPTDFKSVVSTDSTMLPKNAHAFLRQQNPLQDSNLHPRRRPVTFHLVQRGLVLAFKLLPALNWGAFTGF